MKKTTFFLAAGLLTASLNQSFAGWKYTSVSRTEGEEKGAPQVTTVSGWFDGERARIEFAESSNPMMKSGTYMLIPGASKPMYLVNPAEKSYMVWDLDGMMGFAGGAAKMMNMKISEPKVEKILDEAGEKILGYSTRHYKIRTTYDMQVSVFGFKNSSNIIQEEEIWASDDLRADGIAQWMKKSQFRTGNEDLDRLISAQKERIKGFPLRQTMVQTTRDGRGNTSTTKMTSEVTELKKVDAPDSLFVIPSDYSETSLIPPESMEELDDAIEESEKAAGEENAPPAAQAPAELLKMFKNRIRR